MWAQRSDKQPMLQQITPERPRQQRGRHPTSASSGTVEQTGGPYTSVGAGVHVEGPSAEPYTPMLPFFSHASSSQFQVPFTPMSPPTEGFFVGAFQPYSSMTVAPSHSSGYFYPPPLSVYPPQDPTFGSSYGMVHKTPARFIICHWTEWERSSRR
ncbi:hypothetical protein V6N13_073856 [Hibiscus sabdariffa]